MSSRKQKRVVVIITVLALIFLASYLLYTTVRVRAQLCATKSIGDADCNGTVNLVDFEFWRREFLTLEATRNGDFNSDGASNLVDYEMWRRTFVSGVTPTPSTISGDYKIPVPAGYPVMNAKGTYFSTLKTPDSVVRWRASNHHLWNKPLPANTPKSPNSANQADVFARIVRGKPMPNGTPILGYGSAFNKGNPYVFFVDPDKETFMQIDHKCNIFEVGQVAPINAIYPGKTGIPFPAEAKMPQEAHADHPVVMYDYKNDIYFEFWDMLMPNITGTGRPSACVANVTRNFTAGDGMGHPGIMNSGIPRSGGMITLEEAYKLKINHVISVQSYQERGDQPSYPATQFIGIYNCAPGTEIANKIGLENCIFDGQRLRLPANYDTSTIQHPFARAVAEALKTYGMIVADFAGCNCIEIEGERSVTETFGKPDPWDAVFGDQENWEVYAQIPWEDLEVLPKDWGKP